MKRDNDPSAPALSPAGRYWNLGIVALTMASALFIVSRTVADPDLWGHVLFGLDILRTGKLPATDPYSYLSHGHPWINHELMSELAMAAAWETAGTAGLMLLKTVVVMAMAALLYRHLVRAGLEPVRAGLVLILLLFAIRPAIGTVRPHLFTYLFYLLTLLVLYRADRGRPARLWALPILFAVWINFHGGVLAGLGVLILWTGACLVFSVRGRLARRYRPLARTAILATTACALALLLNPYLWRLPAFLFRTATVARPEILEWRALQLATLPGLLYLILVGIGALVLLRSRAERRPPELFVLLCTAVLPMLAERHLSLFALAIGVFLADHLASVWFPRRSTGGLSARVRAVAIGLTFFVALVMTSGAIPRFACIPIVPGLSIGFPARAVALLGASGVSGNMAVHFGQGEYVIWHLKDRIRVSMDGRRETVYPDSTYEEAMRFQTGVGAWDDVLEKRPTELALVPVGGPSFNLLRLKPGWELAHQDSFVAVFGRADWPDLDRVREMPGPPIPPDAAGRCFP